ncbi:Proteasome subunit alpha type-2 [Quaeritorhiza haematococci]|nr:Proteasome subunit alpha type-2 [Quaeritorhiza haematococci]
MADRYSFSLTTFSPSGKLVQIEYALNAVSQGVTSIGIKATNGVVIATEKKSSSPLMDDSSIEKVSVICKNIGMVYSGMGPDARVLVDKARKAAQQYKRVYMEDPPTAILVKEVASIMQEFTQSGGVRPFGVSLLIAGYDENGPTLYQVDPSGSYFAWKATAIGKNMINAKTFLEKRQKSKLILSMSTIFVFRIRRYNASMETEDAVHTAILTLKEGYEGAMTEKSIEIGIAYFEDEEESVQTVPGGAVDGGAESGESHKVKSFKFRRLNYGEVKDYLANIA